MMNMNDDKNFPTLTAILLPGKNSEDTRNTLASCGDFQIEILDCHGDIGAALASAKGEYICILPAGTLLHGAYLTYPIAYLERHMEFDYSVCHGATISKTGGENFPRSDFTSLQITDYFLNNLPVGIAAFIIRKSFLAETDMLSIAASCTFPELLILPLLAFGYGVHVTKSLYTAAKEIIPPEKLEAYIREAHDMIARFPVPAADICDLVAGFDFMLTRKLLTDYDGNSEMNFSDFICRAVNSAFDPSPGIPLSLLTDVVKINRTILLAALHVACKGEGVQKITPAGRIIAYAPLVSTALKIQELLRDTAYEPDMVWAVNADGVSAAQPEPASLTASDVVVVPRAALLAGEFSPASVISAADAVDYCAAATFPALCAGTISLRFSSGYFYDY
jgi:hypothetical protein